VAPPRERCQRGHKQARNAVHKMRCSVARARRAHEEPQEQYIRPGRAAGTKAAVNTTAANQMYLRVLPRRCNQKKKEQPGHHTTHTQKTTTNKCNNAKHSSCRRRSPRSPKQNKDGIWLVSQTTHTYQRGGAHGHQRPKRPLNKRSGDSPMHQQIRGSLPRRAPHAHTHTDVRQTTQHMGGHRKVMAPLLQSRAAVRELSPQAGTPCRSEAQSNKQGSLAKCVGECALSQCGMERPERLLAHLGRNCQTHKRQRSAACTC
jgi:hypothetical protein